MKGRRIEVMLIGAVALAVAATAGVHWLCQNHDQYLHFSGKTDGVGADGLMRNGEIEFVVFHTDWMQGGRASMWSTWPEEPDDYDLRSYDIVAVPDNLFYKGTRVDISGRNKVFVLNNHCLQPVPVEVGQLRFLSAGNIERLNKSPIWPRIQEAVDKGTAENRLDWKKKWGSERQ